MYSGAGTTLKEAPVPMSNGLIYNDPFPSGGTCFIFEDQFNLFSTSYREKTKTFAVKNKKKIKDFYTG